MHDVSANQANGGSCIATYTFTVQFELLVSALKANSKLRKTFT